MSQSKLEAITCTWCKVWENLHEPVCGVGFIFSDKMNMWCEYFNPIALHSHSPLCFSCVSRSKNCTVWILPIVIGFLKFMNHQVFVFHASKERHLPREVCSYGFYYCFFSLFFDNLRETCDSFNVGLLNV